MAQDYAIRDVRPLSSLDTLKRIEEILRKPSGTLNTKTAGSLTQGADCELEQQW